MKHKQPLKNQQTETLLILPTGRTAIIETKGNVQRPSVCTADELQTILKRYGDREPHTPMTRLASDAGVEELLVGVDPKFGEGKLPINMPATVWLNQSGRIENQLVFGPLFVFPLEDVQESMGLRKYMWTNVKNNHPRMLGLDFDVQDFVPMENWK